MYYDVAYLGLAPRLGGTGRGVELLSSSSLSCISITTFLFAALHQYQISWTYHDKEQTYAGRLGRVLVGATEDFSGSEPPCCTSSSKLLSSSSSSSPDTRRLLKLDFRTPGEMA
jgi:hypothetical protein